MRKLILVVISVIIGLAANGQQASELEKQLKTASKSEKIDLHKSLADIYVQDEPDKAIDNAQKALKLSRFRKIDKQTEGLLYQILGEAYYYKMDYKNSLIYYDKELKTIGKLKSPEAIMKSYFNIAAISQRLNKNKKSVEYYLKSLNLAQQAKDDDVIALNYHGLTEVYSNMGKHDKALKCFQNYISIRDKELNRETSKKISILSRKYRSEKRKKQKNEVLLQETKDSLDYAVEKEYILVRDTIEKASKIRDLNEEKRLKDKAIREKEKRLAAQKEKMEAQKKLLIYSVIFIVAIIIVMVLMLLMYLDKRKTNKQLKIKNNKITEQKNALKKQTDTIIEKNTEIQDSIHYAKRIQQAVLPSKEIARSFLTDFLIYFKPKDIVSGDYYWITEIDNKIIMVAADCTGHGVPGAFMSMLGVAFLNEIVNKENITEPDQILNRMREQVIIALQQKQGESKDGMDIVVLTYDPKQRIIQYAGAYNPLYLIRKIDSNISASPILTEDNEIDLLESKNNTFTTEITKVSIYEGYALTVIKGNKMPVAIHDQMPPFTKHELQLLKNDAIYIFSDGYADQFGGPKQKKLKHKAFRELLLNNQEKPMLEQKQILSDYFDQWKGTTEQVDDVLVMGLKV